MASENTLSPQTTRIGTLIDGDERTPEVVVLLRNTGSALEVTLPIGSWADSNPYRRWFSENVHFADDPDRSRFAYAPPRVSIFLDAAGPVVLVGSTRGPSKIALFGGQGTFFVDYAVLGGRQMNYDKINGVRVEMPALSGWTRLSSVKIDRRSDSDGRLESLMMELESPAEIKLAPRLNLGLRPTWRVGSPNGAGKRDVQDVVELATRVKRPRAWYEHFDAISAVRELMMLSAWERFGFARVEAVRDDDPQRRMDGVALGDRWAEVVSHRFPQELEPVKDPRFLIEFADVGAQGVRRWLTLRSKYKRALEPLVSILDQAGAFMESRLLLSGVAVEALGFQLLVDDGAISATNGQANYRRAANKILEKLTFMPVPDPEGWVERSASTYRGVKHADNPLPDRLVLLNTYRENVLVLRFWLASRLGLSAELLEERFAWDPYRHPWREMD